MYLGKNYNNTEIQFTTLLPEQLREIHSASCNLLEDTGMIVHHEEAVKLLKEAGAYVKDDNKVFVSASLVEWAIKSAPSRITLYDRDEKPAMYLENRNVYYGPGSDTVAIIDYETNEKRKWAKKDIENGMILCDYLDNIDFLMSMGIISDVDIKMNTREQYAIMLRKSKKPHVLVCDDANDFKDLIDMFAAVRGGLENLQRKPYFVLYSEPSSPLENSFTAIDKLLIASENKIPTNYATGGMTGATTPITVGGTLVLSNAECLLGLVIHQLKNPGAPFVYGYGNSPMDMKSMQAAYAHPAGMQVQGGMCDLARFYNLPSWGEAGNGCSKKCDEQAAMEASQFILMAALQGCNITHDVGYLDFGLSISFELLVICDEIIGRTKEIVKKVDTTEEYLAVDAIKRVGHGGNYLGDEHTFKHLRENWMGNISDLKSYGDWTKNGSLSMGERAHLKVKDILSKYEPEPLPKEVDKEIENILNRAKKKL